MEDKIAVIRIKLKDSPVTIWRRIHLNPNISLDEFHEMIQIVMGWENYHLYGFRIGDKFYTPMTDDFPYSDNYVPIESATLKEILESNKKFIYEYDFGDGWRHEIVLNKYTEPKKNVKYPVCASGRGICPPEDIGGVWGYAEFLSQIHSKEPEDYILDLIDELDYSIEELKEVEKIPLNLDSINNYLGMFRK